MALDRVQLLNTALAMHQRGFAVVPIPPRGFEYTDHDGEKRQATGKGPIIPGWQEHRLSEDRLRRELNNSHVAALGVVSGALSNNLVVLDFDKGGWQRAFEHFEYSWPELSATTKVIAGSGRRHVWVICPDLPGDFTRKEYARPDLDASIELRGNRCNNLFFGQHPDGGCYGWAAAESELVEVSLADLQVWLAEWAGVKDKPEPFKMPESLPEGTRDTNLFKLACSLRAKGVSKDAALAACLAENAAKGNPPLSESQVIAKVENAFGRYPYREHTQPLGAKIPTDRAREIAAIAPNAPDPELRQLILDTLLGDPEEKLSLRERRAEAGQLMLDWLNGHGGFVQSAAGGDLYYFSRLTGQVYNLETDHWRAWLYASTGVNPASVDFAYLSADCKTAAILNAPKRPIVRVSAWDDDNQVLRVSRFDGTVYALDGESISEEPNGQNVIFEDNPLWLPYNPDFSSKSALRWSTEFPNWEKDNEAHALAFRAWVVTTFFCELCPTRPLLVFIGEKGSGKSMALRVLLRLLFGPVSQLSGVPDKPDGFTAAAAAAHVLVLDNLDTFTGWLRDKLAMISTGGKDEYRKLYTSKEVGQIQYRCWVGFTSRTPDTLRRDDLADRLLLLPVARIGTPSPERVFLDQSDTARNLWWGDLLTTLNEVVARIRKGGLASTSTLRMADWESLGRVLAQIEGKEAAWNEFIKDLERAQSEFLLEDELIVDALSLWLENRGNHGREVLCKDLHEEWTPLLFGQKTPSKDWPRSVRSLGRMLASIRCSLRAYYQVEWRQDDRRRTYYQFAPKE